MVLPASHRVSRVPWYSGYQTESSSFRLQGFHLLWLDFPFNSAKTKFCNSTCLVRNPNQASLVGLGSSRFARRYLGNRFFFLFLWVLRCFSSPGSLYPYYVFIWEYWPITASGLPHSEIPGLTPAFGYPRLFVDRYVLHRLLTPRHSPCALCNLTLFGERFFAFFFSWGESRFALTLVWFSTEIVMFWMLNVYFPYTSRYPFLHYSYFLCSFQGTCKLIAEFSGKHHCFPLNIS